MNESIMKTDRRGRLRYAPDQKKTMVDAYLASGLSAPRFAALHGVNYQTLVSWIKKGRTDGSGGTPGSPHPALLSLVPAEIDGSTAAGADRAMEVWIPGGAKLLVSSPGQVDLAAALIRKLHSSRPC
ncbi:MAG: transposase [Verrucomicrobia bacterium]|nr:transposase [Verrucomicrobiota bacterium]